METFVKIGCLFGGGVAIIERSRAPSKDKFNVLGIGVAVKVSVSTLTFNGAVFLLPQHQNDVLHQ